MLPLEVIKSNRFSAYKIDFYALFIVQTIINSLAEVHVYAK